MNGCEIVKCRYWDSVNEKCTDEADVCIYNAHPTVYKEITALEAENAELRKALEAAYQYLNDPHKSRLGNTEVIDLLHKALSGGKP